MPLPAYRYKFGALVSCPNAGEVLLLPSTLGLTRLFAHEMAMGLEPDARRCIVYLPDEQTPEEVGSFAVVGSPGEGGLRIVP